MFSFRVKIFLIFLSSIHAYPYDDYNELSSNTHVSPRADICLQPGTQCSEDCTTVLYCSDAGATPIVSINCTSNNNQACFSDNTAIAQCSAEGSDCAAPGTQLEVRCAQGGNFPDPYNCRRSYTCEENNPEPTEECLCPSGSNWVGASTDCGTIQDDIVACCTGVVVDCDNNAIGSNYGTCSVSSLADGGYYYICERSSGTTAVSLHQCPAGQIWYSDTFRCEARLSNLMGKDNVDEISPVKESIRVLPVCVAITTTTVTTDTSTTTDTTTTTETTTTTDTTTTETTTTTDTTTSDTTTTTETTTETTTTEQPTPTPPICSFPGQVIPISGNCVQYWFCDQNLQPELRGCEDGTHLDCSINGCYCVVGPGPCPP